jgi:hypothetical protein
MWWYIPFRISRIGIHADIIQRIWASQPETISVILDMYISNILTEVAISSSQETKNNRQMNLITLK